MHLFDMQGAGILCALLQRWVAKLDENGTQAAGNNFVLKTNLQNCKSGHYFFILPENKLGQK